MEEIQNRRNPQAQSLEKAGPASFPFQQVLDVSPEDVPHLRDYWNVLLKRRWVLFSCLLIVFFTVAIATLKQRPVFEGKAVLEVDPEPQDTLNLRDIIQGSAGTDVDTYRATQFKILKSRTLAERVVQDLQLYQYPEFRSKSGLFGLVNQTSPAPPADSAPPDPSSELLRDSESRGRSKENELLKITF